MFWVILVIVAVVLCCAVLSYIFGGRQPDTVALDVSISTIKLLFPLIIVLAIKELFFKEFERRYFLISLSYCRSRTFFLITRFSYILLLLLLVLGVTAVLLWAELFLLSHSYAQSTPISFGSLYWLNFIFIGFDFLVLASVALLLSIVASTSNFILIGTFGFMIIARSFSAIVKFLNETNSLVNDETFSALSLLSLKNLSYFLPDLGALDVRMIALYNKIEFLPSNWIVLIIISLSYTLAFVALSNHLLNKKRFK